MADSGAPDGPQPAADPDHLRSGILNLKGGGLLLPHRLSHGPAGFRDNPASGILNLKGGGPFIREGGLLFPSPVIVSAGPGRARNGQDAIFYFYVISLLGFSQYLVRARFPKMNKE